MDVFDNCRICLCEINHEPIKMTRIILKFIEKYLQLTNVTKSNPRGSPKQNLCAPCFNRLSDFQDFLEQCKDSDEFWKTQFDDLKETHNEKQSSFEEESVGLPLPDDNDSSESDQKITTDLNELTVKHEENEDEKYFHLLEVEMDQDLQHSQKKDILLDTSHHITEEDENGMETEMIGINLTNFVDDTNEDSKNPEEEIIEYEYQIDNEEDVGIEEILTIDDSADSDISGVDYNSLAFEKIDTDISSKSTIIHDPIKEAMVERSQTTQNFFLTTTLDENGKVKMSYKCAQCDKSFNRVYDIESHCNIHSGIKPFTCNVCGKSFRQKNILTTHQTLHFGKKVECAECGKKFARRSQLILHYRMHRDEKPFVCDINGCQAAFRQKKQLIDHSFIHSNEKNFKCSTCSKSFHTRKRLQDHIYKVHSQHRYCCELCEKTFLKPHMLKHHMATAHNVEVGDVSHLKTSVDALKPTKKAKVF